MFVYTSILRASVRMWGEETLALCGSDSLAYVVLNHRLSQRRRKAKADSPSCLLTSMCDVAVWTRTHTCKHIQRFQKQRVHRGPWTNTTLESPFLVTRLQIYFCLPHSHLFTIQLRKPQTPCPPLHTDFLRTPVLESWLCDFPFPE